MKLGQLREEFERTMPGVGRHIFDFSHNRDHEARIFALESILDRIYLQLVDQRKYLAKDAEDKLTTQVVANLRNLSICASHDADIGGHADIVVEAHDTGFRWIAEAKIFSTFGWLMSGFAQLSTRYAVASPGRNFGEIIIYCRNPNSLSILEKWMHFLGSAKPEVTVITRDIANELHFRTTHECKASGLPFTTRHVIIPLHFQPAT